MTKNKKNIAIFLMTLFVVAFSVFSFSGDVKAEGIVKCGLSGTGYDERCKLCDLIIGINDIIKWGRNVLVAVALTAITAGGIMYIVSAGDEQMMQAAKNVIKQALWGVVIVLGAWLIVNTTMYLLAVKDNSTSDSEGGTLGIQAASWNEFSCEGERAINDPAVCGNEYGICDTGTPGNADPANRSWSCTNSRGDIISCQESVVVAECGLSPATCATGDLVSGSGETRQECSPSDPNDCWRVDTWECEGSTGIPVGCNYTEANCARSDCRCDSGNAGNCSTDRTSWDCITDSHSQSCTFNPIAFWDEGCIQASDCYSNESNSARCDQGVCVNETTYQNSGWCGDPRNTGTCNDVCGYPGTVYDSSGMNPCVNGQNCCVPVQPLY